MIVEPGEYREQLRLKDNVRVVSRVPRGATIRLPASASEAEPAVFADTVATAELVGFRIVGDAATPLGVGLFVRDSGISIMDVEITGATRVAIDISGRSVAGLVGSDIHDNPGAALAIRAGATPRISQNTFARNSMSERALMPLIIERGAAPTVSEECVLRDQPRRVCRRWTTSRGRRSHTRTGLSACYNPLARRLRPVAAGGDSNGDGLQSPWTLPDPSGDRPRRHGRGVSRHRHADRWSRRVEVGAHRHGPRSPRHPRSRAVGC